MIINGVVVYPIYIDKFEVADHLSDEEIEEKLLEEADKRFNISTVKPNVLEVDILNQKEQHNE